MLLVKTAIAALGEKPVIAIPRAVPLAGGCSASKATIKKMEIPTASEYTRIDEMTNECGIKAHNEPEKRPMRWPPITRRGAAVMFLGMVNTIKAVAPIEAIITVCSIFSRKSTTNTTTVAKKL